MSKHPVAQALTRIQNEVNSQYFERRACIEAVILAVLAKQHAYILGPPGTGKSEMTRAILERFTSAVYFEQLLSKTRPDQAVLGPYDLPLLREKGDFKRKIDGYLYTAHFAFLDEIGKMSPTMGHDLLAALNERVRHEVNGGHSTHKIPLHTVITASNELIVGESDDAAATWDRLLVRVVVDYLAEPGNFASLVGEDTVPVANPTTVDYADLLDAVDNVVPQVKTPVDVIEAFVNLRASLDGEGIRPSDRRWRQCRRLVQASAFLNGRDTAEVDDLGVLRFALWDSPEQINPVERATLKISNPLNEKILQVQDDASGIRKEIAARKGKSLADRAGYGSEAMGKVTQLNSELQKIKQECLSTGRSVSKVEEALDDLKGLKRSILVECLEMDPGTVGE